MEEEYITNQERLKGTSPDVAAQDKHEEERTRVDDIRGSPMAVGTLEEIIDDDHAIVSTSSGPESYVSIMSFVDKDLLEPGCSVLLHHKTQAIIGVLQDDTDPMVSVMKLDKAPTESYADIGGLEQQIMEIKVSTRSSVRLVREVTLSRTTHHGHSYNPSAMCLLHDRVHSDRSQNLSAQSGSR